MVIGIQGGKGSFNEEALNEYRLQHPNLDIELMYLFTGENVLKGLTQGEIDRGQFAIFNLRGGIVDESIEAMGKYKFKVVEKFAIKISHALMIKNGVGFDSVKTVMAHPQVFAQCSETLAKKYPKLKLKSGEGELIDSAKVGEAIANGSLKETIGVMGSKAIARAYGLVVVEDHLEDVAENFTTFLQVERV